jgi:predicted MarR family transcription regulator
MPKHVFRKIFTREKCPEYITDIHEVHVLLYNIIKNLVDFDEITVTTSAKSDTDTLSARFPNFIYTYRDDRSQAQANNL